MNKLNIRLTNATDCELEFLAQRLGLTEAEVVKLAIEAFYNAKESEMIDNSTELQTRKEWQGVGYYAQAQRGSYDNTHISVEYLGEEIEKGNYNAASHAARVAGLGTPQWVQNEEDL